MVKTPGISIQKLTVKAQPAKRIVPEIPKREAKKPVFKDTGDGGKIVRKKPF